jgi:hypothetical protein
VIFTRATVPVLVAHFRSNLNAAFANLESESHWQASIRWQATVTVLSSGCGGVSP